MEAGLAETNAAFADNPFDQGSEKLFVQFRMHPKKNQAKSLAEGRDIYDDVEYITIMTPGDKDNVIDRPSTPFDHQRFPRQHAAFMRGQTDPVTSGTPLKMWPQVSRAQVEELAFFHVHTVEQLVSMSDENAQKFMGINQLRQKARDFLQAAKDGAFAAQLRAQIEQKDAEIAVLKESHEKLAARLDRLEAKKAKKTKVEEPEEEEAEEE